MLRPSICIGNWSFCQSDIPKVQLTSWQKASSLWFENSFKKQANFIKVIVKFFWWLLWIFIHLERISFERAFRWCNAALGDMLRLSHGLANQSFCWSDISRIQLKFNWTVGESLLAFAQEAVREWRLNLLKGQWISFKRASKRCHVATGEHLRLSDFYNAWFYISDFQKNFCEGVLR